MDMILVAAERPFGMTAIIKQPSPASRTVSTELVVLVAPASAVAVAMVFIMIVIFSNEIFTVESRSSTFVSLVFTISKFVKLLDLVPSQTRRQLFDGDVRPRSSISRSPEPMALVQIIVVTADEIDIVRNADGNIHLRLWHQNHRWRSGDNDRRWLADVDVYVYLSTCWNSCAADHQHQRRSPYDHPKFCNLHHEFTPLLDLSFKSIVESLVHGIA